MGTEPKADMPELKKYLFYLDREIENLPPCCVNAVSPKYAVTYGYNDNDYLQVPSDDEFGILDIYSFATSGRPVLAKVVLHSSAYDVTLFEAIDGYKFFEDSDVPNLKYPSAGEKFRLWGWIPETDNPPTKLCFQDGVMTGMSTDRYAKMSVNLTQKADFGGGLYSEDNKLLGFVSSCLPQEENKVLVVPAYMIDNFIDIVKDEKPERTGPTWDDV